MGGVVLTAPPKDAPQKARARLAALPVLGFRGGLSFDGGAMQTSRRRLSRLIEDMQAQGVTFERYGSNISITGIYESGTWLQRWKTDNHDDLMAILPDLTKPERFEHPPIPPSRAGAITGRLPINLIDLAA